MAKTYGTDQENFWAGNFGAEYIDRNQGQSLLASNLNFFNRALGAAGPIASCVELGANIGMNLRALRLLFPAISVKAVEINPEAASQLAEWLGNEHVFAGSIFDYQPPEPADLSFTKGVLIHIAPEMLNAAYDALYRASRRYILIGEYYNPSPMSIPYRGHDDRLFKRDFAGELMDRFDDLTLLDYGFAYRADPVYPQDDITWFLMEKRS